MCNIKIEKLIEVIDNIGIQKPNSFDELKKIITSKSVIDKHQEFLDLLYDKNNINSKVFLYMYVIGYFPEININESIILDKNIFDLSVIIINLINQIKKDKSKENFNILHDYLEEYKSLFTFWKKQDLNNIIKNLAIIYCESKDSLELLLKYPDKSKDYMFFVQQYNNQLLHIDNKVQSLNGTKLFEKYRDIITEDRAEKEKELKPKIQKIVNKAFWDSFENKINKDLPDFDYILILLEEVVTIISKIIHDKKVLHELHEFIDIDFVKDKINNKVITNLDFVDIMMYIINVIYKCNPYEKDSPQETIKLKIMNPRIKEWERYIEEKINKNESFASIVLLFFKNIYKILDDFEYINKA